MIKLIFVPIVLTAFVSVVPMLGQTAVDVNIPGVETSAAKLTAEDEALIRKGVLPAVRKKIPRRECEESFEPAGMVQGSFSQPNISQKLVFYQFCQSGNGVGWVGLILIENGKIVGNYVADVGWTVGIKALPDINKNGLSEVALYYSGGIHQGAGGTGVDIVELSSVGVRGIGWFQAESFSEETETVGYRVTAKPGSFPKFFREKYVQTAGGKWKRTGRVTPFYLQKAVSRFTPVK